MKNTAIIAALLIVSAASAQIEKGTILAGGGLSFSGSKSTNTPTYSAGNVTTTKYNNYSVEVYGGYFFADNLAGGLSLSYQGNSGSTKAESPSGSNTSKSMGSTFTPALFLRGYKMMSDNFGMFGHLDLGYAMSSNKTSSDNTVGPVTTTNPEQKTTSNGLSVNLSPGFVYFLSDRLGLEMRYGRLYFTSTTGESSTDGAKYSDLKSSSYGLDLSLRSFSIGASLYFGRKSGNTENK